MKDITLDPTDLTWLAGLARALLKEPHAADDLVQDTAIAAMECPMPPEAPPRAWLASVARRLAARRLRGEARRSRREALVARPEALPDSAELVEKAEIAEQVTAAVRRLEEPYRRTILLRYLEGRSTEEIAREEGKPQDSIRWRLRRGLELLRLELVQGDDREWSSWSVLLLPLARVNGDVGLATAGASGSSSWTVVSLLAMKVTIALTVVLSGVGLWMAWGSDKPEPTSALGLSSAPVAEEPEMALAPALQTELVPEAFAERESIEAEAPPAEATAAEPPTIGLLGKVVDTRGNPVSGATVYLIPTTLDDEGDESVGSLRAQTESSPSGNFRLNPEDWLADDLTEDATLDSTLDLGVVANGYLRTVVPDVLVDWPGSEPTEELTVVLERGASLSGRVVDTDGNPVSDIDILICTANAGVDHVSPSQRVLRAGRKVLTGATSQYDQGRSKTDGRGEIRFAGLPSGDLRVLSLDPGWTIETPGVVVADETYIEWTAKKRLGARLSVFEAGTNKPVERAAATFGFDCTFANGETMDMSQWVGRGNGVVTYVFDPTGWEGVEGRTIVKAVFYGTARSEDGESVDWVAEPMEDPDGVTGVAEVRVEVLPEPDPAIAEAEALLATAPEPSRLVLDVRYLDGAPFEGELQVEWNPTSLYKTLERDRAKADGPGRYLLDVVAADLTLEAYDRNGSGSFQPWRGEAACYPNQDATVFVTLPRGASATITRPDGWREEWWVTAWFKLPDDEDWRGSLTWSTADNRMDLDVLRPAEWKFELRRESSVEPDPLVRTVFLGAGDSVVVDE